MNSRQSLSTPAKATIAGLVTAAAGISILFLSGSVNAPTIPFGPIILLLVAGLVALGRLWWAPAVGALAGLGIMAGAFIAPGLFERLGNPAQPGGFSGTWLQMLGLATALVAGIIATVRSSEARTRTAR